MCAAHMQVGETVKLMYVTQDRMGLDGVESPTARIAETANELYVLDGTLLAIINANTGEETRYELRKVYP